MDDLLWTLWGIIIWVVLICTLLATIRMGFVGLDRPSNYSIVNILSSEKWCMSLFLILPATAIDYGTNRLSPLPWTAFTAAAARHGVADGILSSLEVCITDLWLLWVPAQMYARDLTLKMYNFELKELEPEKVRSLIHRQGILIRIINVLVGLLLMTPNNPMIALIKLLP
jgi:hypothetical protein